MLITAVQSSFMHISFDLSNNPMRQVLQVLLSPFCSWGNWGLVNWVAQRHPTGIRRRAPWLQIQHFILQVMVPSKISSYMLPNDIQQPSWKDLKWPAHQLIPRKLVHEKRNKSSENVTQKSELGRSLTRWLCYRCLFVFSKAFAQVYCDQLICKWGGAIFYNESPHFLYGDLDLLKYDLLKDDPLCHAISILYSDYMYMWVCLSIEQ